MTPETLEWLSNRVPGFAMLSREERDGIIDFSFLWSLFEGKVMDGRCDVPRIREYVLHRYQLGLFQSLDCEPYIGYLKNRYYGDGEVTDYYNGLHLERSGNPIEVIEILRNKESPKEIKIIGCLIIVYRLRNNLFHGEKWHYELQGQLNNFTQANVFIKQLIQLSK